MEDNIQTQLIDIQKMLIQISEYIGTPKQWLNTNEVSHYLGYSKESIHKMVKNGELKRGQHYHKKVKRLLFNKLEIDKWVMSDEPINKSTYNQDIDKTIEDILSSIAA